ncbi:hypothetical protein CP532_1498 [Ophiocordyceps camponoti-leonardi (nom. inval.)]|nr:hypothetical protein CP532_1498 [Ophiocordyceps camponoti-leonardi (nom. inval.)]
MEPTPSPTIRVPWNRLRAWIDEQEEQGQSLTKTQLEALSRIIPFCEKEPDVSGGNFVSLLTELVQARRLPTPTFVDEAITVPVDGHLMQRFRCVCSVAEYGSFPDLEEGGREAPVFQNKKDAKQFAAKHAFDYLKQHTESQKTPQAKRTSPRRLSPAAPSTPHPSQRRKQHHQKQADDDHPPASASSSTPSASRKDALASASSTAEKIEEDDDDDGEAMIRRASDLAARMGFGTLSFAIEPDPELENFFHGRPVFSQSGGCVPADVAVVTGVLGKKQARVQVAANVFIWLEAKAKEKRTTFANLFSISR